MTDKYDKIDFSKLAAVTTVGGFFAVIPLFVVIWVLKDLLNIDLGEWETTIVPTTVGAFVGAWGMFALTHRVKDSRGTEYENHSDKGDHL